MTTPTLIEDFNLSESWLKVLEKFNDVSGDELSPLIITITDLRENRNVREYLDEHLFKNQYRADPGPLILGFLAFWTMQKKSMI